ncbi:MAG: hypothetical protein ACXACU_09250 [Candidatus Hodarchaeales archaeon]|jgi:hypothetical protein
MSPKRIIIQLIHCSRNPEKSKNSTGFQASGYKEYDEEKKNGRVGFIVSGVKVISFQQMVNIGIRTRIKWIPNGFEIREEIHPLNGVIVDLQRRNNVIFVGKGNSAVIMQGEANLTENEFVGQLLRVKWMEEEFFISPLQKQSSFHCALNSKNNRIDCFVK